MQILLLCTFGQEMMNEYDALLYQFFRCDWPEILFLLKRNKSKNCQTMLVIFMETLKRDRMILIGKVFPLELKLFTSVNELIELMEISSKLAIFINYLHCKSYNI